MITLYSETHRKHNPPMEFLNGTLIPYYETPERIRIILEAISEHELGPIRSPEPFDPKWIEAIHTREYLEFLNRGYRKWVEAGGDPNALFPSALAVRRMNRKTNNPIALPGYYCFDMSAPIVEGTYDAALSAVHVALAGAQTLEKGEQSAYALCRPPGHHAETDLAGGYCFMNNAAVAAQYLCDQPSIHRVAILDIDIHHGNGTQQIFYARNDVVYISLHIDPQVEYPYFSGYSDEMGSGCGIGYNRNLPLPPHTENEAYLMALDEALAYTFSCKPDVLIVSAGFDTFIHDPLGGFDLTSEIYPIIGKRIAQMGLPTLFIQEGGYAIEALGINVYGLLSGYEGAFLK